MSTNPFLQNQHLQSDISQVNGSIVISPDNIFHVDNPHNFTIQRYLTCFSCTKTFIVTQSLPKQLLQKSNPSISISCPCFHCKVINTVAINSHKVLAEGHEIYMQRHATGDERPLIPYSMQCPNCTTQSEFSRRFDPNGTNDTKYSIIIQCPKCAHLVKLRISRLDLFGGVKGYNRKIIGCGAFFLCFTVIWVAFCVGLDLFDALVLVCALFAYITSIFAIFGVRKLSSKWMIIAFGTAVIETLLQLINVVYDIYYLVQGYNTFFGVFLYIVWFGVSTWYTYLCYDRSKAFKYYQIFLQ